MLLTVSHGDRFLGHSCRLAYLAFILFIVSSLSCWYIAVVIVTNFLTLVIISGIQRRQTVECLDLLKHSRCLSYKLKMMAPKQVKYKRHFETDHLKNSNIIDFKYSLQKRMTVPYALQCLPLSGDLHTCFSACISSLLPFCLGWAFFLDTFSFCTMWKTTCSFFPVRSSSSDWFRMVIVTSLSKKSFATASIIPARWLWKKQTNSNC